MDRIRIGCVKYLNTLPLVEGLQSLRDVELVSAVPSRLIGMLRGGEVDVALASVVDAVGEGERREAGGESDKDNNAPSVTCSARITSPAGGGGRGCGGGVVALPVGMIGCDGPTMTVRVFSRAPIEKIRTVGVDTDSHTSVVLMRVILARRHGVRVEVFDFDARERIVGGERKQQSSKAGKPQSQAPSSDVDESSSFANPPPSTLPLGGGTGIDALLLIGDKVVTDAPASGEFPHQLDLGQAWKEMTGLPFVYAVWMCRAGEEGSLAVRTAAAVLDRQRRHNATRLEWLVATRAPERHWPTDLAAEYIGKSLKYDVGEAEREAVEKFVAWGHELGLCGSGPVKWAHVE